MRNRTLTIGLLSIVLLMASCDGSCGNDIFCGLSSKGCDPTPTPRPTSGPCVITKTVPKGDGTSDYTVVCTKDNGEKCEVTVRQGNTNRALQDAQAQCL